jgi:hypothetical protein
MNALRIFYESFRHVPYPMSTDFYLKKATYRHRLALSVCGIAVTSAFCYASLPLWLSILLTFLVAEFLLRCCVVILLLPQLY